MLLSFLKLRLVVNGMHIYNLRKNHPVRVTMPTNPSHIVVTDGYHISHPVDLRYQQHTLYFDIVCAIDNDGLIGGFIFMLMFFAMGASAGLLVLQVFSLLPILYVLSLYYIRRAEFIRIRPA